MAYNSAGAGVNIHASGPFPPPRHVPAQLMERSCLQHCGLVHHLGTCPQLQLTGVETRHKPAQRKVEGESSASSRVGRQVFQFEVSSLRLCGHAEVAPWQAVAADVTGLHV